MIRYAAIPQAPVRVHTLAARKCKTAIIGRMADAICEMAGSGEVITEEALQGRDFSPAVVARFKEEARAEARRRFIKRG